jgi:hypothetical protein
MVNLNASKKSAKGGNGGGTFVPWENILVELKAVYETDPKKPTPDKDYIEAYLLYDACGIKAEFEEDTIDEATGEKIPGAPKTVITARIKVDTKGRYGNPDPAKTPLEMWDLKVGRKKGTSGKMGESALIVLEKAKKIGDNDFEVGFIYAAQRDRNSETDLVIENVMAMVGEEGERTRRDGTIAKYQERKMYLAEEASLVTSMDELRAAVVEKLTDPRAERPFAMIHVVGTEPTDRVVKDEEGNVVKDENGKEIPRYPYEARSASVFLRYENEEQLSAEESFDRWFTDVSTTRDGKPVYERDDEGNVVKDADGKPVPELRHGEMIEIINNYLGDEGLVFEVIGGFTYNTGKNSLPSARGRMSDHFNFQMDWENRETGLTAANKETGKNFTMQGLTQSHMVLGRVEDNETPGTYGPWYAQKTFTTRSFNPAIFLEREIITPNTPPAVAAVFVEEAERRSKAKSDADRARRAKNGAAVKEDDDIPVADREPDYAGGMAMNR